MLLWKLKYEFSGSGKHAVLHKFTNVWDDLIFDCSVSTIQTSVDASQHQLVTSGFSSVEWPQSGGSLIKCRHIYIYIYIYDLVPKGVHENRTKGVENKVDDTLKLVVFLDWAQC